MARFLKQSTAKVLRMGPFLDDTDGKTAETGLTIAQADIQISKNGGAFAQTSDAAPTTTHDADGWYQVPLTATDTETCGPLTVQVLMTGALPVWEHFHIVAANIYDSLFAASGTDILDVSATQFAGQTITCAAGVTILASVGTAATSTAQTGDCYARLGAPAGASVSADVAAVKSDTAAVLLDTGTDGVVVAAASKTGYALADTTSDAVIADAVWNAATATYGTTDTYGALIESGNVGGGAIVAASVTGAVGSVTGAVGSVTGAVGSVTGAVASVTGNVGGNVVGSVGSVTGAVGSVTGNVGGNVTGSVGSIATGGIAAASFAAGAIDAAAIATGAIDADALAADAANEIADAVLSRNVSNVEASAAEHTLCTVVLAMLENSISGTTLTIKRTDGSTTHATKTLTTNAAAEPITGIA